MNANLMKLVGTRDGAVGTLLFLFPFLSLVTLWGVSLASFVFFIAALFFIPAERAALRPHWPEVRGVVFAFLFHFLFAFACYLARSGDNLGTLEKPSRMFFAISALVLVLVFKPHRRMLWWGVVGGAMAGVLFVAYQRLELDLARPGGWINAITFGDISLCLGLVALAAAVDLRGSGKAHWASLGALTGLTGSILTGTRGGWIALFVAALVFIRYSHVLSSKRVRALVVVSFALVGATFFIPEAGVRERVEQGVYDVTTYFGGGSAFTNVGIRLELWKGAGMLIAENPLFGMDLPSAHARLAEHVKAGRLDAVVLPMPHFHNDALQRLVTGGVVGFAAWLSILLAPLIFFARVLSRKTHASKPRFALALAGMLVVTCYFSFGLTEVIFWSVKASLFYALMVFLLMGLCLNAKETDGK